MQHYDLSSLPTGERVISEHVPSVRSVSLGFWIGTGSRDETDSRAGVSHFIEHLLFKGTGTHTAQEIAEIFDGLGGELNAATSRETTLVYARVPDDRLEAALDVIVGMVYDPVFAEVDAEREVVLEEIAMVDDNPQDLVHDVVAEAVFGGHPLGRPVIGRASVISSVSRKALATYHRGVYAHDNIVVAAAGNVKHERVLELLAARIPKTQAPPLAAHASRSRASRRRVTAFSASRPSSTTSASARPGSRASTSAASPRRCSTRSSAAPPPRGSSRRSGRSAGWRTRSTASPPSTPTPARSASTSARARRTSSSAWRSSRRELTDVSDGNVRDGELERAKENLKGRMLLSMESTSNRMSRLGKSLITGSELLSLEELVERVDAVTGDEVAEIAGDLLRLDRLSAAGIGPERGAVQGCGAARQPGTRRAQGGMKVFLLGRNGKVGSVLGPALEEAGHELVDSADGRRRRRRLHTPGRGGGERARLPRCRRAGRRRDVRLRPGAGGGARSRA